MSSLSQFESDFSVDPIGVVSLSYRGLARIVGVSDMAIRKLFKRVFPWLKGANLERVKLAGILDPSSVEGANLELPESLEKLRQLGFEGADLETNSACIPDTHAICVVEYYAFDAGRNRTKEAKEIYRASGAIGFRTGLHRRLGWNPPTIAPNQSERIVELEAAIATLQEQQKLLVSSEVMAEQKQRIEQLEATIASTPILQSADTTKSAIQAIAMVEDARESIGQWCSQNANNSSVYSRFTNYCSDLVELLDRGR
jgi:hypothetical protein